MREERSNLEERIEGNGELRQRERERERRERERGSSMVLSASMRSYLATMSPCAPLDVGRCAS